MIGGQDNGIISCLTKSTSELPEFLRADGTLNELTLLDTSIPLKINIEGVEIEYNNTSITLTSLTTAPATNNTCLVDDANLTGQEESKFQGEDNTVLTVDTMGSEITSLIGTLQAFKIDNGSDIGYFYAYVKSATELTNLYRGWYFDSTGNPVRRITINDGDTITLLNTAYIYAKTDGATLEVNYNGWTYSATAPGSPLDNDVYFDLTLNKFRIYNLAGAAWEDCLPIGMAILDDTACIATKSFDFAKIYDDYMNINYEVENVTTIKSIDYDSRISSYGEQLSFDKNFVRHDIATDLESPFSEEADTKYYAYITQAGEPKLSPLKPHWRPELKGYYHPTESWRYVVNVQNDSGSDFAGIGFDIRFVASAAGIEVFTSSGTFLKKPGVDRYKITVTGGGGGAGTSTGASAPTGGGGGGGTAIKYLDDISESVAVTIGAGGIGGVTGGTSSFGSYVSATGGSGTNNNDHEGGVGGNGISGDLNIKGTTGGSGRRLYGYDGGGAGGGSIYGQGGLPCLNTVSTERNGSTYGAGGAGVYANSGDIAGSGYDGVVIVEWVVV